MQDLTLAHIVQNKMQISVLAVRFGFDAEVRLMKGSWDRLKESTPLHLVVRKLPGKLTDPNGVELLAVKLAAQLNCKVNVSAREEFPDDSVPLFSEAICKLFQVLTLDAVKLERWGAEFPKQRLIQANNYLADEAVRVAEEEVVRKKLKH